MKNEKWVFFDMDGTLADLYSVENWLSDLQAFNPKPYKEAQLMYNREELQEVLTGLRNRGYKLGIISYLSKNSSHKLFNAQVRNCKKQWLHENGLLDFFDVIHITQQRYKKHTTCKKYGYSILVDDEEKNLLSWNLGATINAKLNILEILRNL